MELSVAILGSLSDDDESIVQIDSYLKYLSVDFSEKELLDTLEKLYDRKLIKIAYSENTKNPSFNDYGSLKDLWFRLTMKGKSQLKKARALYEK